VSAWRQWQGTLAQKSVFESHQLALALPLLREPGSHPPVLVSPPEQVSAWHPLPEPRGQESVSESCPLLRVLLPELVLSPQARASLQLRESVSPSVLVSPQQVQERELPQQELLPVLALGWVSVPHPLALVQQLRVLVSESASVLQELLRVLASESVPYLRARASQRQALESQPQVLESALHPQEQEPL
jgi:hypothetical protein